jgi:hypothetical protein
MRVDITKRMPTFESILSHLGPSARPLMAFLQNKEATELLTTSKYVTGFVSAYAARWGFAPVAYSRHANGDFTLRTATQTLRFRPLRHWEELVFKQSHYGRDPDGTPHYCVGKVDNQTTSPLIYGSKAEITAIRDAAKVAARVRQEATYTIRGYPPPLPPSRNHL